MTTGFSSVLGCASLPRRGASVDDVSVEGEQEVDEEDIQDKIATRKSPKFLALFRGVVYDYEISTATSCSATCSASSATTERAVFTKPECVPRGSFTWTTSTSVSVIEVEEGPPVTVRCASVSGLDALPAELRAEVRVELDATIKLGDRFEEERLPTPKRH